MDSCPGDKHLVTDPGKANVIVGYDIPTATDNSGENIGVHCHQPPLSTFIIGKTLVICEARDSSGNKGRCTFSVTVRGKCH